MCQYLCEIQTVGAHDNLIRLWNLTRAVNFCGTGVRIFFIWYNLTGVAQGLLYYFDTRMHHQPLLLKQLRLAQKKPSEQ